jgi:hypothetical protein
LHLFDGSERAFARVRARRAFALLASIALRLGRTAKAGVAAGAALVQAEASDERDA